MWKNAGAASATVFALLVVGISSIPLSGEERLGAPTNVTIKHRNQTAVVVFWNFTKPENVPARSVMFTLDVRSHGVPVTRYDLRFDGTPLHHIVTGLKPMTEYSLELSAEYENWGSTDTVEVSFTTLRDGWAEPVIVSMEEKDTGVGISFTVKWDLYGKRRGLKRIKLDYCSDECNTIEKSANDTEATLYLDYNTEFRFRIGVVFNASFFGPISRSGPFIARTTSMGKPRKVEGPTIIERIGNELRVEWQPLDVPNGPLSYYEVLAVDVHNPFKRFRKTVDDSPSVILDAPDMFIEGRAYELFVRAVNVQLDGRTHKGDYALFRFRYKIPPKPKDLKILELNPNGIRFKVLHEEFTGNPVTQVKTESPLNMIDRWNGTAEVYNLLPYEEVKLSARGCYKVDTTDTWICGEYGHYKLTSNVKAPSPVPFLNVRQLDRGCIELKWDEPLNPKGPLDGFVIFVLSERGVHVHAEKHMRPPNSKRTLSICHRVLRDLTNLVGIARFNHDLQNKTAVHYAPIKYAPIIPREGIAGITVIMSGMSVCCGLLSLVVVLICLNVQDRDENVGGAQPENARGNEPNGGFYADPRPDDGQV